MRQFRPFLTLAALAVTAISVGGNVSWLSQVTTPPPDMGSTATPLSAIFPSDKANSATPTLASWKTQRGHLRQQWLKILGPLPQPPESGMQPTLLADESLATCTRTLIKYEAEPGRFVRAYILRPPGDQTTSRPAVVVFHPTNTETIKVVAGTGGRVDQHLALRLVERGFVVICPENYIFEEKSWTAAAAAARKRHPQSTGMATMLADGMRAVDVVAALPGVDPERIGAIGHSLGAKEVLYLMAFDERVKAGVFSEGGIGLSFSNWDAPWYLGPQVKRDGFGHDHHELLALIAPRPFLIFGGESGRAADGDRTWSYVQAANTISAIYGKPPRIGFINHHLDHSFPPAQAAKGFDWLEDYLK